MFSGFFLMSAMDSPNLRRKLNKFTEISLHAY